MVFLPGALAVLAMTAARTAWQNPKVREFAIGAVKAAWAKPGVKSATIKAGAVAVSSGIGQGTGLLRRKASELEERGAIPPAVASTARGALVVAEVVSGTAVDSIAGRARDHARMPSAGAKEAVRQAAADRSALLDDLARPGVDVTKAAEQARRIHSALGS